ncbi:DGQHR domain-containing protein [Microvirga arabica]|uniref:DGQHR domain-containing protein n=1 Tax=Microvirga arabica TaxID=1128671 RepID=UPI00193A44CE|nr:DGQHR domain-containing protein [Microvirga arabica]
MYTFSMRAAELRQLCDVYKRTREGTDAEGIQRVRDVTRTGRIQRYVQYGYPYGDLKPPQRTPETLPLRKPGWLPTAIVVNILTPDDVRRGKKVSQEHLIGVEHEDEARCNLILPPLDALKAAPLAPLEVIDGQHRLWAFDADGEEPIPDDFELPVVAFHGLDIAWQAYLFWSINVSPKRINPSHAFDLYPLLRTQDWLDRVGELTVYREARAQELTELMFGHPKSPWVGRINMLGERGAGGVSQAAWVRALLTTFLGTGRGQGRTGLFQANLSEDGEPLEWSRAQQAAFLIQIWLDIQQAAEALSKYWWIRQYGDPKKAFLDKTSMLNQDMGVRAVLAVVNDIFFQSAERWQLESWLMPAQIEASTSLSDVDAALESLANAKFRQRMQELAEGLVGFDWRSLEGPGVKGDQEVEVRKRSYRGSGGYTALTEDVLRSIAEADNEVGRTAAELLNAGVS